jgi:hypothetical protein
MHIEELVSLSEPIPCPIVFPIHIYGTSVRLNCSVRVLHLDILVTHERPGGEVRPIELRGTPEVSNGLFVFCSQRVVVTYNMYPSFSDVQSSEKRGEIFVPTRQQTSGRSLSRARKSCASLDSARRFSVTYKMLE